MLDKLRQKLLRRLERLTGQSADRSDGVKLKSASLRAQGNALIEREDWVGAEALFRDALTLNEDTQNLVCLGYVLIEQGLLPEARVVLNRAAYDANSDPATFEAYYLLGQLTEHQGDSVGAENYFLMALRLKPDFSRACNDLIRLMQATSRHDEVKELLQSNIRRCPNSTDYRIALAKLYSDSLDFQAAAEHLMVAISLGVNDVPSKMNIGAAFCRLGRESEAIKFFQMAEEQDPSVSNETNYHLGYLHSHSGDLVSAVSYLEKSIQHDLGYLPSHSLMLLVLSFANSDVTVPYELVARRFAKAVKPVSQTFNSTPLSWSGDSDRPLCVGFMSGEFRLHPVYFFLVDVLKHLDSRIFRPVIYSNNPYDDSATAVLKERVPDWYNVRALSDENVAKLIHSHQVDVLIDLSGHTGDNKLAVFAHRPAPVQVSWLGYFASTGMEEMDYILADPVSVPVDSNEWFSEQVVHLPTTRLCMAVPTPSYEILVTPPPCLRNGYVTFGSFQQGVKITIKVLSLWNRVLNAVPRSRLRIQTKAVHVEQLRDRICVNLTQVGIDMSRVDLVGSVGMDEYLEAHAEVDILLDTFPFPGGTTTAFALWMGVPTVSLVGNTMLARQGAMMLNCVGLSDWAVTSEDAYVVAAETFANDVDQLARLRRELRSSVLKSPLFDSKRFAVEFQDALLQMYEQKRLKQSDGKCPSSTAHAR